jgi:hypothetical protein
MSAMATLVRSCHDVPFKSIISSIEDAPAPMALHSFKTSVLNGQIHVTAFVESTLKQNMSRQPTLLDGGVYESGPGVVIVGGGSGTFHAVESLREVRVIGFLSMFPLPKSCSTVLRGLSPSFRKRHIALLIGNVLSLILGVCRLTHY